MAMHPGGMRNFCFANLAMGVLLVTVTLDAKNAPAMGAFMVHNILI